MSDDVTQLLVSTVNETNRNVLKLVEMVSKTEATLEAHGTRITALEKDSHSTQNCVTKTNLQWIIKWFWIGVSFIVGLISILSGFVINNSKLMEQVLTSKK